MLTFVDIVSKNRKIQLDSLLYQMITILLSYMKSRTIKNIFRFLRKLYLVFKPFEKFHDIEYIKILYF